MADLREMARAEADAVEAEEEEAAEAEEAEQAETEEAETENENVIGEAEIRKAEKAIADQRARLGKIVGDDMVAHECLLCTGIGFLPELPPPGATLEVVATDDGLKLDIRAPGVPVELKDARDKGACDWCDGYGQVRTHSKNPNAAVASCSKCNGHGWVTVAADVPTNVYVPPVAGQAGNSANGQQMEVPNDAWDRPYGHPHYGMPPSMIGG